LQKYADFEFRTGEDIKGEPSEKQKEKIRKEEERLRNEREEKERQARIEREEKERRARMEFERVKRERAQREAEENKKREQEKIENELQNLFNRLVRDFQNAPYSDKIETPRVGGEVTFKYRFENGWTFEVVGNKVTYTDDKYRYDYTVGLIWRKKFVDLANEMMSKQKRRPTSGYKSSYDYDKKKSEPSSTYKETPKTGNPQRDKYNLINDKIKLREDQLRKMKPNDPDRTSLENELNSYKRVRDKMKKEHKFEKLNLNMKHLKLFEAFQNELTEEQTEDLNEIFFEFVKDKKMDSEEAQEYFTPGTQNFANFLQLLEDETTWFDYTQMDGVLLELSNLLIDYETIETEEIEFEEAEAMEIEEGDFVDFGEGYGKVYVVAILGDGYLVNEDEEQRFMGEQGDGFIIPWSKIKDYNIIEKGSHGDDLEDFDEDDDF
jgi:hypothetical protein